MGCPQLMGRAPSSREAPRPPHPDRAPASLLVACGNAPAPSGRGGGSQPQPRRKPFPDISHLSAACERSSGQICVQGLWKHLPIPAQLSVAPVLGRPGRPPPCVEGRDQSWVRCKPRTCPPESDFRVVRVSLSPAPMPPARASRLRFARALPNTWPIRPVGETPCQG